MVPVRPWHLPSARQACHRTAMKSAKIRHVHLPPKRSNLGSASWWVSVLNSMRYGVCASGGVVFSDSNLISSLFLGTILQGRETRQETLHRNWRYRLNWGISRNRGQVMHSSAKYIYIYCIGIMLMNQSHPTISSSQNVQYEHFAKKHWGSGHMSILLNSLHHVLCLILLWCSQVMIFLLHGLTSPRTTKVMKWWASMSNNHQSDDIWLMIVCFKMFDTNFNWNSWKKKTNFVKSRGLLWGTYCCEVLNTFSVLKHKAFSWPNVAGFHPLFNPLRSFIHLKFYLVIPRLAHFLGQLLNVLRQLLELLRFNRPRSPNNATKYPKIISRDSKLAVIVFEAGRD